MENAVRVHQDAAEFYWQLIGNAWDKGASNVSAVVNLPGPSPELIKAYGHGPLNGTVSIPSASQVTFSSPSLEAKTYFEVRVLFDKTLLDSGYLSREDKTTLNDIFKRRKVSPKKPRSRKSQNVLSYISLSAKRL